MSQHVTLAAELSEIIHQVKIIEARPVKTRDGISFSTADETTFRALVFDAKSIYDLAFGVDNTHWVALKEVINKYSGGYTGGPSLYAIQSSHKLMETALKQIRRLHAISDSGSKAVVDSGLHIYVSPSRIDELKALPKGPWDLNRLIRMLEELNVAYANKSFIAIPILVRAIKDHIPPLFGHSNFASVAASMNKSTKGNFMSLENSLKNIADGMLHTHIRKTEVIPNEVQVDFRSDLDVLLSEVIRSQKDGFKSVE